MSLKDYRDIILPLQKQMDVQKRWLRERLDSVIPSLMKREGIDMWLVICREYNEDPVIMSMLPAPAMSARRRTILVFSRKSDGTVDRLSIDRYGHGDFYKGVWEPEKEEQWACLGRIVKEHNPDKIGVNYSKTFAFADGLTYTEAEEMNAALGEEYMKRCVSAENLVVGWLETRIPNEMASYPSLIKLGHTLIAEAFSSKVILPGVTTTDDVVWWMRQTMQDMGLQAWFQPDCEIQAPRQSAHFLQEAKRKLIMPGDLLWCDVGFYYLGLATDQQQHAYVLKPNETEAPQGLRDALHAANRVQEIHMHQMKLGMTGNEVLKKVLEEAKLFNINAMIYSHPLGFHGHAAGPTIGLWDKQDGVPGRGDYPVHDNTVYSIELNIRKEIPEWDGQEIRIAVEEDAVMSGGKMRWLDGHQTEFHLIG